MPGSIDAAIIDLGRQPRAVAGGRNCRLSAGREMEISMADPLVTPVILCGGAGTRLWPVSREKMPKIFVPLIGETTSFQQVLDRVTRAGVFAPPIVITNSDFRFVAAEQARSRGVDATII